MANQIAEFFAPQPEPKAAEGVANHLQRFWTPKMIAELVARSSESESGLDTTAAQGVTLLKTSQKQA
jgi:formate dehydrogenase subunit delta